LPLWPETISSEPWRDRLVHPDSFIQRLKTTKARTWASSGLPDFSRSKHTKTEKICQMTICKLFRKAVNYTNGRKIF
jgi:hypothetical protein